MHFTRHLFQYCSLFFRAGEGLNGFVNVNGSKVAIRHDGVVRWMVPVMVSSACAVDVTYFPYDRQVCTIQFGSWIYDKNAVDIKIDSDLPDLDHYVMNSEYDFLSSLRIRTLLSCDMHRRI